MDASTSTHLSSLWVSSTGSTSDWHALQEALHKCIDTIQYNKVQYMYFQSTLNMP